MTDQRICCGTIAIIYTYTQTLNAKPNISLVPKASSALGNTGNGHKAEGKKWFRIEMGLTHQCVW